MTNMWWYVNKVSRGFSLLSNFTCRYFFNCLFVNVHWHNRSWMSDYRLYSLRFFFSLEIKLYLYFDLELLFNFAIRISISIWYFALCFLWEVTAHKKVLIWIYMTVKFQKTSKTSKSFENNILSRAIWSAFEINISQFFITVVAVTC